MQQTNGGLLSYIVFENLACSCFTLRRNMTVFFCQILVRKGRLNYFFFHKNGVQME